MNEVSLGSEGSHYQWLVDAIKALDKSTFIPDVLQQFTQLDGEEIEEYFEESDEGQLPGLRFTQTNPDTNGTEQFSVLHLEGRGTSLSGEKNDYISTATARHTQLNRAVRNAFVAAAPSEIVRSLHFDQKKPRITSDFDVGLNTQFELVYCRCNSSYEGLLQLTHKGERDRCLVSERQKIAYEDESKFPDANHFRSEVSISKDVSLLLDTWQNLFNVQAEAFYDITTKKLQKIEVFLQRNFLDTSLLRSVAPEAVVAYESDGSNQSLIWERTVRETNSEHNLSSTVPEMVEAANNDLKIPVSVGWLHPSLPKDIMLRFSKIFPALPRKFGHIDPVVPEFLNAPSEDFSYDKEIYH